MATLTYSSLTSRQTRQSSASGPLTTTPQNGQISAMTSRNQSTSSGTQLVNGPNSSRQISSSPGKQTNYQINSSHRPASRITSQPVTPNKPLPTRKESPGAWKHPQAEEIARRQRASTFGADNISLILKSIATLLVAEILRWSLPNFVWKLLSPISQMTGDTPVTVLWMSVVCTILFALKPLYAGPDQLLDIDLNATQRSLLGLDPNATPPATPTTRYVTPPKYTRSATPRTGSPGSRGSSPGGSPLAYKDNTGYRRSSDSFSSSRRASFGSDPRRQSFGLSASVFGTPFKEGSIFGPQTPSPSGRGSGIPFSNKWLYHKGISSSTSKD